MVNTGFRVFVLCFNFVRFRSPSFKTLNFVNVFIFSAHNFRQMRFSVSLPKLQMSDFFLYFPFLYPFLFHSVCFPQLSITKTTSWSLNDMGVRGPDLLHSQKSGYNLWLTDDIQLISTYFICDIYYTLYSYNEAREKFIKNIIRERKLFTVIYWKKKIRLRVSPCCSKPWRSSISWAPRLLYS